MLAGAFSDIDGTVIVIGSEFTTSERGMRTMYENCDVKI